MLCQCFYLSPRLTWTWIEAGEIWSHHWTHVLHKSMWRTISSFILILAVIGVEFCTWCSLFLRSLLLLTKPNNSQRIDWIESTFWIKFQIQVECRVPTWLFARCLEGLKDSHAQESGKWRKTWTQNVFHTVCFRKNCDLHWHMLPASYPQFMFHLRRYSKSKKEREYDIKCACIWKLLPSNCFMLSSTYQ